MNTLEIGPIEKSDDGHQIEAILRWNDAEQRLYFNCKDHPLTPNPEAFVALTMLPCMKERATCTTEKPPSPRFLEGLEKIQPFFQSWKPNYTPVKYIWKAPKTPPSFTSRDEQPGHRVGVFFSGGVDSFYSLLKNKDDITDLIFIHGFDIRLENVSMRSRMSETVARVAANYAKGVVEIETNMRAVTEEHAPWGLAHGAALAGTGHLLSPEFTRIYIAASHTPNTIIPWGSNPELDPLWSSEALEFIHDGYGVGRERKIALVSQSDIALQSLHVCMKKPTEALNCGECEKCLRTMINLQAYGVLDRCTTFAAPLTIRKVYRMYGLDKRKHLFLKESLQVLEERHTDPGLEKALRQIIYGPHFLKDVPGAFRRLRARIKKKLRN